MAVRVRKRFSERDYQREKLEVLKLLERVTLFTDGKDAEERIRECENDYWLFARTYFGHYLTAKTQAEFHPVWIDTIESVREKVVALDAPRGTAKSTLITLIYTAWKVLYQKRHFVVINSETIDKSEMMTWRLLIELQYNPRLLNDFGKIVSDDAGRGDFLTLTSPSRPAAIRVLAFGAGMSMRGLVNGQYRPDLIINDDLESRGVARNPKRVDKLEDIVLSDNLGAVCSDDWQFVIIGTIICRGSFLHKCSKNKAIVYVHSRSIENMGMPDERATWPEVWPLKKLYALLATMGRNRFMAEKQNEPLESDGIFDEAWFRFIRELPKSLDYSQLIDQIDPSYSEAGDNKACFIMGLYAHGPECPDFGEWRDTNGKVIEEGLYTIVARPYNRKSSIDEFILELFKRFLTWRPVRMAIDGSFAQKHMYRREIQRVEKVKGVTLPVKFTDQQRKKTEKIMELQPDIERGVMLFLDDGSQDMEDTIIQFTRFGETGIPDDGPDAIAEGKETLKRLRKKAKVTLC